MSPVLEMLEARAGASDTDREAWLAQRRTGVTATEIRDLYLGKITLERLVALKLGREVDSFAGNAYTAWGNEREPVIAAVIEQRFGIRPESRVFAAADNPRYLASPDGVGVNFDEEITTSEIKTSGADIPPWSDAYAAKGYEPQQQWVLRVLGARRSLFAWELRDGRPGEFRPGRLQFEWVERNDAMIAELERIADEALAALDKATSEPWDGPGPIDEVLDTHALNYLRGLAAEKEGKALKESAYGELLAAGRSQVSALHRVTYTPPKPGVEVEVEEIDRVAAAAGPKGERLLAALRAAQAAWDDHCEGFKTVRREVGPGTKAKVTVTAIKQKEQSA